MTEIWKPITINEGIYKDSYHISNLGRVKSLKYEKDRILKYCLSGIGYGQISLCVKGLTKKFYIHRLVAEIFILNPDNKLEVNHIDGNKLNNNVNNLEWSTPKENSKHSYKIGLSYASPNYGELNGRSKLTEKEVLEIREIYQSLKLTYTELSAIFNVSSAQISNVINKRSWKNI